MALKRIEPGIRFAGAEYKVDPDEANRYEVFTIRPGTAGATYLASAGTAGTASSIALTVNNRYPDWPRNIEFALAGSATGMAGTATINGKDQFGASITENFGFGSADNGGTVLGSKVFARIDSGTLNYGTAVGNGTPSFRVFAGTGCLLGLPVKIGSASDVVFLGMSAGTGPISYGGGTISGFVGTQYSTIRPAAAFTGTQVINVWVKSTYNAEGTNNAALAQAA